MRVNPVRTSILLAIALASGACSTPPAVPPPVGMYTDMSPAQDCRPRRPVSIRPLGLRIVNECVLVDVLFAGEIEPAALLEASKSSADHLSEIEPSWGFEIQDASGRDVRLWRTSPITSWSGSPPYAQLEPADGLSRVLQVYRFRAPRLEPGMYAVTIRPSLLELTTSDARIDYARPVYIIEPDRVCLPDRAVVVPAR